MIEVAILVVLGLVLTGQVVDIYWLRQLAKHLSAHDGHLAAHDEHLDTLTMNMDVGDSRKAGRRWR